MSQNEEEQADRSAASAPAYQRRKEQRPDEILAAGLEEFYEHGFAGARLDRIAERAGVSRSTLYLYFDNKDSLFTTVAEHAIGGFVEDAAQRAMSFEGTTAELLRQLFQRFYGMILTTKNSAILRILISEGPRLPHLVERYHGAVIARGNVALKAIVERGIERGEIRPGPVAEFPQILVSPAMFFVISRMVFGELEKIDAEAFIEAHLDLVLNGIGHRSCDT